MTDEPEGGTAGQDATDEATRGSDDESGAPARTAGEFEALVERAEAALERLADEEDGAGEASDQLDELEDVVDEAEDLLSTVDVEQLAAAVEWENLPEAVDVGDVPEAVREGDPTEAIAVRKLLSLGDLSDVWESVDSRELWREKRQLEDEVDDVTDDDADDSIADVDGFDSDVDMDVGDASTPDVGGTDVDPESVEKAVQSNVSDAVGEFREKLLEAHDRLERLREENESRFEERRTRGGSRNPTAGVSTMPSGHVGMGGTANHSTVPDETKYSTAPNRERIYGDRFESAGGEDGG